jgi:hypothetical protein
MLADRAHVLSADIERSSGDVVEARDERDQRTLAGTGGSNDCRGLAGIGGEADIMQNLLFGAGVAERDVSELDRPISLGCEELR